MKDKIIAALAIAFIGLLAALGFERASRAKEQAKRAQDDAAAAVKLQKVYAETETEQNEEIKKIHNTTNRRGRFT